MNEHPPLAEKVAEARPVDDAVGKIDDKKKEVVTSTSTAEPPPKPVEKKPDVKPKEEPKPPSPISYARSIPRTKAMESRSEEHTV